MTFLLSPDQTWVHPPRFYPAKGGFTNTKPFQVRLCKIEGFSQKTETSQRAPARFERHRSPLSISCTSLSKPIVMLT